MVSEVCVTKHYYTHLQGCYKQPKTICCSWQNKHRMKLNQTAFAQVHMDQPVCTCICICACVHVCIHMHACWPDGSRDNSGGMVGVKHLYGSKPRSGQLQWPMFKVNGGLRWPFISRLLHPCWTQSANRHQPSSSSPSLLLLCPQGPVLKMPVHRDPL